MTTMQRFRSNLFMCLFRDDLAETEYVSLGRLLDHAHHPSSVAPHESAGDRLSAVRSTVLPLAASTAAAAFASNDFETEYFGG